VIVIVRAGASDGALRVLAVPVDDAVVNQRWVDEQQPEEERLGLEHAVELVDEAADGLDRGTSCEPGVHRRGHRALAYALESELRRPDQAAWQDELFTILASTFPSALPPQGGPDYHRRLLCAVEELDLMLDRVGLPDVVRVEVGHEIPPRRAQAEVP